ncbi:MAG: glycosyltransferase family 9 protein [Bacteroidales bacterium]|nr:glycosyltransferase family 9 protein [Bacteroidales bacterium]
MKKILVIQTASLGDVILSTPILEKLHHFFPDAKIDFLLKYGYESLFRGHPFLQRVMVLDKTEKKNAHLAELIRLVRDRHYDAIINVQRFASSGLVTAFSGAKHRIGFSKNPLSLFFTRRVKHQIGVEKDNPHEIERNLRLIAELTDEHSVFPMKLYPGKQDFAKVSQFKTKKYITVAPGSLWFTKQFPAEKWVEFVAALEEGLTVYFLGSPKETGLCDRIIESSQHPNSLNLSGKLSFLESAALLRDAQMNYVNDSAPMHLASAMNAPTTAVFCSTVPGFGFGPMAEKSFVVQASAGLSCRPCGLHGLHKCPKQHFNCALTIQKEQLLNTL